MSLQCDQGEHASCDTWHSANQTVERAVAVKLSQALKACLNTQRNQIMNRIIWIVGLVVIILFILGFLGLR